MYWYWCLVQIFCQSTLFTNPSNQTLHFQSYELIYCTTVTYKHQNNQHKLKMILFSEKSLNHWSMYSKFSSRHSDFTALLMLSTNKNQWVMALNEQESWVESQRKRNVCTIHTQRQGVSSVWNHRVKADTILFLPALQILNCLGGSVMEAFLILRSVHTKNHICNNNNDKSIHTDER